MGLLSKIFGEKNDFGPEYKNWKGPWLVYNGTRVPLDIKGLNGDGTIEVESTENSSSQTMSGSFSFVDMCSINGKACLNGVDLETYVSKFKEKGK